MLDLRYSNPGIPGPNPPASRPSPREAAPGLSLSYRTFRYMLDFPFLKAFLAYAAILWIISRISGHPGLFSRGMGLIVLAPAMILSAVAAIFVLARTAGFLLWIIGLRRSS